MKRRSRATGCWVAMVVVMSELMWRCASLIRPSPTIASVAFCGVVLDERLDRDADLGGDQAAHAQHLVLDVAHLAIERLATRVVAGPVA